MQALILNGLSAEAVGGTTPAAAVTRALRGAGWTVEEVRLAEQTIPPCLGCFGCWTQTPGVCLLDDVSRENCRAIVHCQLLVFLTPVTFGGYSSHLKKQLDRSIPLISPLFGAVGGEIHHRRRYRRYPSLLGVGLLPEARPRAEELFTTLVQRNAINLHAPAWTSAFLYDAETDAARAETLRSAVSMVAAGGRES